MTDYLQKAMDIAHDKEQTVFQQRNAFQELLDALVQESKEKVEAEAALRERQREQREEELRYLPPL